MSFEPVKLSLSCDNFFPHLIIHPENAEENDLGLTWAVSIILGIFTVGLVHLGCALYEHFSKNAELKKEGNRTERENKVDLQAQETLRNVSEPGATPTKERIQSTPQETAPDKTQGTAQAATTTETPPTTKTTQFAKPQPASTTTSTNTTDAASTQKSGSLNPAYSATSPQQPLKKVEYISPFFEDLRPEVRESLIFLFGNATEILDRAPPCPTYWHFTHDEEKIDFDKLNQLAHPISTVYGEGISHSIILRVVCADPEAYFERYEKSYVTDRARKYKDTENGPESFIDQDHFLERKEQALQRIRGELYLMMLNETSSHEYPYPIVWEESSATTVGAPNFFNNKYIIGKDGALTPEVLPLVPSFQKLILSGEGADAEGISWKIINHAEMMYKKELQDILGMILTEVETIENRSWKNGSFKLALEAILILEAKYHELASIGLPKAFFHFEVEQVTDRLFAKISEDQGEGIEFFKRILSPQPEFRPMTYVSPDKTNLEKLFADHPEIDKDLSQKAYDFLLFLREESLKPPTLNFHFT